MPATAPRPRSPAQIEAARRNGARSRGPVTPEGKARAPATPSSTASPPCITSCWRTRPRPSWRSSPPACWPSVGPESEIEARLVKRMAIAFWKSERAERIEVALFDAAPKLRPPQAGFEWEEADPLTTFDLKRFNAVRGYQAQQGRELSRCLKELRLLRREPLAECTGEPESASQNEPGDPPQPANDDVDPALRAASRHEPLPQARAARGTSAELDRLLLATTGRAWPTRRHRAAAAGPRRRPASAGGARPRPSRTWAATGQAAALEGG